MVMRIVGIGYEEVTAAPERWAALRQALDSAAATHVGVAAGRADWVLKHWDDRPSWSAHVRAATDLLPEALAVMRGSRRVVLVVDIMTGRVATGTPAWAGTSRLGARSTEFASLSQLARGEVGAGIAAYCGWLAETIRPDAISLTELFMDDTTYGETDLADYRAVTGATEWPRSGGGVDVSHPSVVSWRCEALASLVKRCRDAAAPWGVEVWAEVRAAHRAASVPRRDSAQDWLLLDRAAQRLVVWDYQGLSAGRDRIDLPTSAVVAEVVRRGARDIVSPGLWRSGGGAVTPAELERMLRDSRGVHQWVTPSSLMDAGHWDVLRRNWR